jgi:hypothetical protein
MTDEPMASQNQISAIRAAGSATKKQTGTDNPSLQAIASRFEVHQPPANTESAKANRGDKHWLDYATVFLSFVAAIGAILAAIFSGYQGWVARDTEERQLRPYLYVIPADSSVTTQADGSVQVSLQPQVKVFGLTMAGGVNPQWELKIADYPMADNFTFNYFSPHTKTNAVAAPNEPYRMPPKTIIINKDDVAAMHAGKKRIYAEGTVLYYDAFRHLLWTNFCLSTDFKRWAEDNGRFDTCPIHNSADWNRISKQAPIEGNVPME